MLELRRCCVEFPLDVAFYNAPIDGGIVTSTRGWRAG
jgi:hypothetical protein